MTFLLKSMNDGLIQPAPFHLRDKLYDKTSTQIYLTQSSLGCVLYDVFYNSCWPLIYLRSSWNSARGLLLFSKILKHLLLRIGMALQASTIRAIFGRRSLSDPIRLGLLHTSLGQVSRKGLKTKKLEETATHLTWEGD